MPFDRKAHQKVHNKIYKAANPERCNALHKKYAQSEKGRKMQAAARQRMLDKNPNYERDLYHKYKKENPEKFKNQSRTRILKQYGLTIETYEQLLISQEYKCAICRIHKDKVKKNFDVDHCHKTGKVRGLLCRDCNTSIGKFKDDPVIVQNAADYLKKNQ